MVPSEYVVSLHFDTKIRIHGYLSHDYRPEGKIRWYIWQKTPEIVIIWFFNKKIFLGNLSIFIKLFENIFCCLSNALNGTFWKFSKILPIFRDICQNRFLYKPKIAFLRKLNDGILMLRKDKVLSL